MNKYLIDILKIRTSITLPGFGALMIANSKTGKIIINKFVKYDDGVLAKFIVEKEGIELTEAKNLVAKFVKEINAEVEKGGTYSIYEFGDISKNDKDELIFTPFGTPTPTPTAKTDKDFKKVIKTDEKLKKKEDKKIAKEQKQVEKSATKVISEKVVETITPKVKEIVKKENVFIPNTKNTADKKEVKPVSETSKTLEKTAKKIVTTPKTSSEENKKDIKPITKTGKTIEKTTKKVVASATTPTGKEKVEADKKWKNSELVNGKIVEKKKKKRWLPLLLILLLLGGIGFGGYKYQNKIKSLLGMDSNAAHHDGETDEDHKKHETTNNHDESNETGEDSNSLSSENEASDSEAGDVGTDEVVNSESESTNNLNNENETVEGKNTQDIIEEPTKVESTISNSSTGSYHIIGGGFGVKANAEAFATKHGGKVLGRFDQLYLVALKSYDSRADAKADLSNLKSIAGSAWIFKYN